jgi:hypothetical protein
VIPVKDKVGITLSDGKGLLRLALYSLIESIRNDPVKYGSLIYYNNMSSTTTDSGDFYFMEYHTAMLVTEAEKLYNKLVKDLVNMAIDDAVFSRSSTLSSRQQQQRLMVWLIAEQDIELLCGYYFSFHHSFLICFMPNNSFYSIRKI